MRIGGTGQAPTSERLNPMPDHQIITYLMIGGSLAHRREHQSPRRVALVEEAANRLTAGNETEAVALAMRRLLEQEARAGSLFGAHPGSVKFRDDVDLTAPCSSTQEGSSWISLSRRGSNASAIALVSRQSC